MTQIEGLADDPGPSGAIKVQGHDSLYRLRVGDYRVIYAIEGHTVTVLVTAVGHRRDVYRGL